MMDTFDKNRYVSAEEETPSRDVWKFSLRRTVLWFGEPFVVKTGGL